jgi:predicted amidophosphoribosyltransferase
MRNLIRYIKIHTTPCLHCGSFANTELKLCSFCRENLKSLENKAMPSFEVSPYPIVSFYKWSPGESDILSKLLVSLKGPRGGNAWTSLAERFVTQRMGREISAFPIQIVPAPPSDCSKIDHAYLWARGLAAALGAEVLPCLVKSKSARQRGSARKQRQRIKIDLNEKYSSLNEGTSKQKLWIFADDVLTTGSTANAAYEALGCPENFEVWVLGHRSLSCEASKSLL